MSGMPGPGSTNRTVPTAISSPPATHLKAIRSRFLGTSSCRAAYRERYGRERGAFGAPHESSESAGKKPEGGEPSRDLAKRAVWREHRAMELVEGLVLEGQYRLRQLLGRGGMGQVWEAEHTRLPKRVAIKFLLGLGHAEPELLMRFRREAEIASRLNHPSIVQVTDFNLLPDGTAYLVMERLEGEDLRARLARGPLSVAEVRDIVKQVASALALAHAHGVVHRDLKPENVFLCREPDGQLRAKVLDFGISKVRDAGAQATRDDRVLGTPGYMAPEQALGKNSSIDGRTDLFALATIVYEMLTGAGVFVGETLAEVCTKVLYHTPRPLVEVLPAVPPVLSRAVSQALAKEPGARQPDVRAFAQAVVEGIEAEPLAPTLLSGDVPVSPRSSGTGAALETTRGSRRAPSPPVRRTTLKVAAPLAALLLGGAWLLWPRSAAEPARGASVSGPPVTPRAEPAAPAPLLPAAIPATAVEPARDAATEPSATSSTGQPRVKREREAARLPEPVATELAEAERALAASDLRTALRLARKSLQEVQSERAYAVMARVYCAQRDLGMVQAMLRNLSPGKRQEVRRECQAQGMALP